VLPTVPFGVNTGQLDIRLTINMNPSTQAMVLGDIVDSLDEQGVRKLVILNSHGGNDFRQMIREMQPSTGVFVAAINWWNCVDVKSFYDVPGDHAGELETSVMMEITPDLVLPLSEAGDGSARKFRIPGLKQGLAWAPRSWTQVTDDTGSGDPAAATREKGIRHLDAVTTAIADFLVDLSNAESPDSYE
jgi:creatinine amidohydrolase